MPGRRCSESGWRNEGDAARQGAVCSGNKIMGIRIGLLAGGAVCRCFAGFVLVLASASVCWAGSVVPESDPASPRPPMAWDPASEPRPRLLFSREDIPAMRKFVNSPEGRPLMEKLEGYRKASKPPKTASFLRDATDGQRQGFWKLPTVALHYVLTGDEASLRDSAGFIEFLLNLPDWETGEERNSGMSSANIMIGAALAFDWLYDDLDPDLRERFREKLMLMARWQYYGGHLMGNSGTHYWQGDPQNNHRWHRDAGLTLAALTAANGDPSENWLLSEIKKELDFVAAWLPQDGTSHESASYLVFGASHLTLAMQAGGRAFGAPYLKSDFFKNAAAFRIHSLLPGLRDSFSYGDGSGLGHYNGYLLKAVSEHGQADLNAMVRKFREASPDAFAYAWMDIIWTDPALPADAEAKLPSAGMFEDIGTLFIREDWSDDARAAMFRCGPFGGLTLNRFRNENGYRYVNVAHDDPDANSFTLHIGGETLAETDRYSNSKKSSNHNTILINGVGQESAGRTEGKMWTQPAVGRVDMTEMAFVTAYRSEGDLTVIEGEAAGSYKAIKPARGRNAARPDLDRYRRIFVWKNGEYVLVLDDIRAPEKVHVDWLMQARGISAAEGQVMRYTLESETQRCSMQTVCDAAMVQSFAVSTADDHGKSLGWRQLVLTAETDSVRVASVFGLWGGEPSVKLVRTGQESFIVEVTAARGTDRWEWNTRHSGREPAGFRLLTGGAGAPSGHPL